MKKYELTVGPDYDAVSPFEYEENVRLIGFHRKRGDRHEFATPQQVVAYAQETGGRVIRVWLREHSSRVYIASATCPFNDKWDSGFYGYLLFEREYFTELGWQRMSAKRELELEQHAVGIMQDYTNWANGWVYQYTILEEDGDHAEHHTCGGFYNEEEARNAGEKELAVLRLHALASRRETPLKDDLQEVTQTLSTAEEVIDTLEEYLYFSTLTPGVTDYSEEEIKERSEQALETLRTNYDDALLEEVRENLATLRAELTESRNV